MHKIGRMILAVDLVLLICYLVIVNLITLTY
jgi:hypothetical protein